MDSETYSHYLTNSESFLNDAESLTTDAKKLIFKPSKRASPIVVVTLTTDKSPKWDRSRNDCHLSLLNITTISTTQSNVIIEMTTKEDDEDEDEDDDNDDDDNDDDDAEDTNAFNLEAIRNDNEKEPSFPLLDILKQNKNNKMNEEISSDVGYLLNLLNETNICDNKFELIYNNQTINGKNQITKEETQEQPNIIINKQSEYKKYLTLVMIDPDAPSSDNPITGPFIHWILASFNHIHGEDGQNICKYMGPGPRSGTGKHRYIFLLYESDAQIKEDYILDTIPQRRKFPLKKFVGDNHLTLISLTFFNIYA
ncbi:unnamed protein product [Adineta steineri]|uniref:Phosphatidylethanolamine-binding protein n=1 Tax=Adineta steineri TaxID=433720 RepID=A0A815CSN8_9BILA|nr:unnamed protein product [Adineta steineri]